MKINPQTYDKINTKKHLKWLLLLLIGGNLCWINILNDMGLLHLNLPEEVEEDDDDLFLSPKPANYISNRNRFTTTL